MGELGPSTPEFLRKNRAVKASDIAAIFHENAGTEKPLFLDIAGLEEERYSIALSEGPRTQFSSLDWGFESKPAGSPSMEIPYGKEIYIVVLYGPKEVYLSVGEAEGSGFGVVASTEDRSPPSAFYLEDLTLKPDDPKLCFCENIRIKSLWGDKTTYLSVCSPGGDGSAFGLRMVEEAECDLESSTWRVKHGNDLLGTGIRAVGMDPAEFPPKPAGG